MALNLRRIIVTTTVMLLLAVGSPVFAQANDSAAIDLVGTVQEFVSISIDEPGNEATVDIVDGGGNLATSHGSLFTVKYSANTDFEVTVGYGGTLTLDGTANNGGVTDIDYDLTAGGTMLATGDAVTGLSNPTKLIDGEETFDVVVELTGVDKNNVEAGDYTDTATFTITAQ